MASRSSTKGDESTIIVCTTSCKEDTAASRASENRLTKDRKHYKVGAIPPTKRKGKGSAMNNRESEENEDKAGINVITWKVETNFIVA
ncbi:hypothetical protein SNE40_022562 [Patella caerulea]|uniref:Uncharacterized protein n=1 Tax=Patella caerulea TaxID=87958 RepID=A0AAN8G8G6_PATCE